MKAIFKAESAGLPKPFIRPDFPSNIANLIKVAPDGTILKSLAPPPTIIAPYVSIYDELVPGVPPNEVQVVHFGSGKPNTCDVVDAYSFKVLRSFPV